jgi:hypothetical protein
MVATAGACAASADLSIPVHSHTPDHPVVGTGNQATIDYDFTVHNGGTTVVDGATLTVSKTGSQQFGGGIGPNFFHDNGDGTYTTDLPSLSPGEDRQVGIYFTVTAAGALSATATVASANDPVSSNNKATESATAVNQANVDLQMLSIIVSPEPAAVGDLRHYHGVLYNDGPDTALDISVGIQADTNPSGQLEYDQYERFVGSSPAPSPAEADPNGFRYLPVGNIPAKTSVSFDVYYTAIKDGIFQRNFFTRFSDEDKDPDLNNNHKPVVSIIDENAGTTGLSALFLTLNGSSSPAGNLADSVLQFAAQQSGAPSGIKVRLQKTTTPKTESSWGNVDDGNGGRMIYDASSDKFVLNTTTYPLGSNIYFRAIYSANGFDDSISNVIGPINLSSTKQHLQPPILSLVGNGHIDDLFFRATFAAAQSGVAVRVQSTKTPGNEASWFAVGPMTQTDDAKIFQSASHNYPDATAVYFRAIASEQGFADGLSTPIGPVDIAHDVPPEVSVTILTPSPLPNSGDGASAASPIVYPAGSFSVKVTALTNDAIRSLSVRLNSDTKYERHDGGKSFDYSTAGPPGDYVLEGQAIDSRGGMARETTKKYLRFVATAPTAAAQSDSPEITAASDEHTFILNTPPDTNASWSDPAVWTGLQSGIHRVPGPGDFAILPKGGVVILDHNKPVTVTSLSVGDLALVHASESTLTVTGTLTLHDRSGLTFANLIIPAGGTANVQNISPLLLGATTIHCDGKWNLQGTGVLTQLEALYINGQLVFHAPIVPPPAALQDPTADAQGMITNTQPSVGGAISSEERAKLLPSVKLISQDGANFIGSNGANYVPPRLISDAGGNIVSENGSGLVRMKSGGILGNANAGILGNANAGIIGDAGASVVSNDGGTKRSPNTPTPTQVAAAASPSPAPSPTGVIQTGGNIDLNGVMLVGGLTMEGGVLSGSGRIVGDLVNNGGYISPGHPAGVIGVQGNFMQGANGTMIIEVAGAASGQYDELAIKGTAQLGGALDLKAVDDYQPTASDYIAPIGFKSSTGNFSSVSTNGADAVQGTGVRVGVDPSQPNPPAGEPLNISTRLEVLGGDNVLIVGFIVQGPAGSTKKVLIRGLGPSLVSAGVTNPLGDPLLILHKPDHSTATNDDWQQGDASQIPDGFAPGDPHESAMVVTLPTGTYTAELRGAHGETGIGLVEAYDLSGSAPTRLANVSTRGFVDTGDNVMIGGFYVGGTEPGQILVRALGPSLADAGVPGALQATTLEVHDKNGAVLSNQGWRSTQESDIIATTIPPTNDNDSAIVATLVPGAYTAIVRGANNTTGIALVEAYSLQ